MIPVILVCRRSFQATPKLPDKTPENTEPGDRIVAVEGKRTSNWPSGMHVLDTPNTRACTCMPQRSLVIPHQSPPYVLTCVLDCVLGILVIREAARRHYGGSRNRVPCHLCAHPQPRSRQGVGCVAHARGHRYDSARYTQNSLAAVSLAPCGMAMLRCGSGPRPKRTQLGFDTIIDVVWDVSMCSAMGCAG